MNGIQEVGGSTPPGSTKISKPRHKGEAFVFGKRVTKLLIIGAGGFVGAVARFYLSGLAHRVIQTTFPVGTLLVNAAGCFAIGCLMYFADDRAALGPQWRMFLGVGLLGALTTFSTFGYETLELLRDRQLMAVAGNIVLNVVVGISAVFLGRALMRSVF